MANDPVDEFMALPRDQQLSTLQGMNPQTQDRVLAEIKKRKGAKTVAPAVTAPTQPQDEDWRDKYTKIQPHGSGDIRGLMVNPAAVGREALTTFSNIGAGALSVILHPVDTASGIARTVGDAMTHNYGDFADQMAPTVQQFIKHPVETVEQGIGQTGVLEGAGEAVGPMARSLKETSRKMRNTVSESVTGTGPRVVKELAKDTTKDNLDIAKKNAEAAQTHLEKVQSDLHSNYGNELQYQEALKQAQEENAKAVAEHVHAAKETAAENEAKKAEALKTHQEDTRETRKSNVDALTDHIAKLDEVAKDRTAGAAILDAREGLQHSIEDATKDVDVRTEKARHDALREGNSKYSGVNEALNHVEANPEFLPDAVINAGEKIKGSDTSVSILSDMEKRLKRENTITYEDLQGYYSELGREITKGSLPGDVFHALDTLHEAIGEEMQRIADSKGQGKALTAAREYWRRMKQTFGDTSDTVSDRAGKEVKEANPEAAKGQVSEYRRRLLGSFDPQIPILLDAVDKGTRRLKDLPTEDKGRTLAATKSPEAPEPTPIPKLKEVTEKKLPNPPNMKMVKPPDQVTPPDRPIETPGKKISTEDVQQAKEKALNARVKHLTAGFQWAAGGMAVMRILTDVAHGNIGSVPSGLLEGGMGIGGIEMVSRLLENPKIVEKLTHVTDKDLAAIPPGMRGDLKIVVQQAQKQGIKVDPRLAALVGAGAATVAGPRTQELQQMRRQATEIMHESSDAELPPQIQRIEDGLKVRYVKGQPYGNVIASVGEHDPRTIEVNDVDRFNKGPLQTRGHEIVHLWRNNLPGPIQKMAMPDNASDPYNISKIDDLRAKGYNLATIPQEMAATIVQTYIADPSQRKKLQPWIDDMDKIPMSVVEGTDPGQKGINTAPRPPMPPTESYRQLKAISARYR